MPFFGRFFSSKKEQKNKNKEGFRAKWGGPSGHLTWSLKFPPPPHLTLKTPKKNKKETQKIKKEKETKTWKYPPKKLFNYQSIFGGFQNFLFFDN